MSKPDIPPTRHMPNNVPATTDKVTESDVSDWQTCINGFHRRQRNDKAERTGECDHSPVAVLAQISQHLKHAPIGLRRAVTQLSAIRTTYGR